MEPQKPPPDGKPYAVAYVTVAYTYHRTLEDQLSQHLACLAGLNPDGYYEGIRVESWESQHGHWLLAEHEELQPKRQT